VRTLKHGIGQKFVGTSNVLLAMQQGLTPLGTMAHEYLQACQDVAAAARFAGFAFNTWAREYAATSGIAVRRLRMDASARLRPLLLQAVRRRPPRFRRPVRVGRELIAHYQKMRIDRTPRRCVLRQPQRPARDPAVRLFRADAQPRSHRAPISPTTSRRAAADRRQDDPLQRPAGGEDQRRADQGDGLRSVVRRVPARGLPGAVAPDEPVREARSSGAAAARRRRRRPAHRDGTLEESRCGWRQRGKPRGRRHSGFAERCIVAGAAARKRLFV